TVKLFAAASALEMLGTLDGVSATVPMELWPLPESDGAPEMLDDSNNAGGLITAAHEIRKLFVVSDNRAFNRLYDLVGHEQLNTSARRAGLDGVVINHRLAVARTREENMSAPRVVLRPDEQGAVEIAPRRSLLELDNTGVPRLEVGTAEVVGSKRLERPKSFLRSNRAELVDLQNALATIVRPEVDVGAPGYDITQSDRELLAEAMTWLPRECPNPAYDPETYPDDWVKFMLEGVRRVIPAESIRYANKFGLAYGFTTENAYVEDLRTGRSFFLAGTMYTNRNETLNDNVYEYDEQAIPLWRAIGESLARRLLLNADGWEHEAFTLRPETPSGELLGSWMVEPREPFTHAVLSFNADVPADAGVQAEVSVPEGDGWSEWMAVADWGEVPAERRTPSRWAGGTIAIDELIANLPVARMRVRVVAMSAPNGVASPMLARVDVVVSRRDRDRVLDAAVGSGVRVDTPFRPCEITNDAALASRLCSPTALAMLLAQRATHPGYTDLIERVYDAQHDLYGVWPRAIQAAHTFGVPGRLHRFGDWAEVRDHLSTVGPIAISLRAAEGEVRGMGYDASSGHIIVLTGVTESGDAIVVDPAFGDESEARRTYPAHDLSEVWLRRARGTAYVLLPSGER
ncbi:MAG: C39 family peptidase, partial [Planctomycetota bacterium]